MNRRPTGYESVALPLSYDGILWAGRDSNPRSRKATDLQSARFDRLPTYPKFVPYPGIGPGYSQISLWVTYVSSPLNDRFLLSRPITSVRHQFGVQYTPTVPYGEGFQEFRTSKETPIGFMCSTNCRGRRGDLNPILHSARVACFQVTLPGPYKTESCKMPPAEVADSNSLCIFCQITRAYNTDDNSVFVRPVGLEPTTR